MEQGLSVDGWRELVVKSGAATTSGGAATGGGLADDGTETGRVLAALLTRLTEVVSAAPSAAGNDAAPDAVLITIGNTEIRKTTARAETKIDALAEEVSKLASSSSAEAGDGQKKLAYDRIIATIAEICQELRQPLAVVNCTLGIMTSGMLGTLTESQRDTLRLATDSGQRLALLVDKLVAISGVPASLAPDQDLIKKLYR